MAAQIFRASTTWEVRDGRSCKFWTDPWIEGKSISEIAPLTRTLAAGHDELRWRWTDSGAYSAKTCYRALFHGSISDASWKLTWKTWAPLRIKAFIWLALQDRCWTADRLARRGLPHNDRCVLCDQATEDMHHLFAACPFSRQIWHEVLSWCRSTATIPDSDTPFVDWWIDACSTLPAALRKGLNSIIALTAWALWKHQNGCVFDQLHPSIASLLRSIQEDARLWASAGANGLATMISER
nr:uncharacterized protein LOC120963549 [Aegilops tauschii subsp. strangulata]